MEAQLQIRQNAQEVQAYMKDLFDWEKSIKQKEGAKRKQKQPTGAATQQPEPPIRGCASGAIAPAPQELQQPAVQPSSAAPRRARPSAPKTDAPGKQDAAAHTYKNYDKWDKFDVDAAIASHEEEAADVPVRSARASSKRPAVPAPRPAACAAAPADSSVTTSSSRPTAPSITLSAPPSSSGRTHPTAPSPVPTTAPKSSSPNPSTPEEWRARGNSLFQAGQYESALDCYSRGIAAGSSCLGHANRAMALLKLNRSAEAEQDATAAIALDPAYVKAYQRRGAARRSMQQWLGAGCDFEEALRLEPGSKALQADRDECLRRHMEAHGLEALSQQERVEVDWPAAPSPTAAASIVAAASPAASPAAAALPAATAATPASPAAATTAAGDVGLSETASAVSLQQQQGSATGISPASVSDAGIPTSAAAAALEAAATRPQSAGNLPGPTATQAAPQAAAASTTGQQQQQQQQQQRVAAPAAAAAAAQQVATKRLQRPFKQPRTSIEFESAWRSLQQDPALQADYLVQLPAEQLPLIFKSSLTAQVLGSVARVALTALASGGSSSGGDMASAALEPAHAVALLTQLPKVPRFDMAAMCIVSRDKTELRALWDAAVVAQGQSELAARLADVRLLYKL